MQTPNTNAEIILPYPWSAPNRIDDIMIANDVGTIILSLFKNTPLNNSSSQIGEMKIVEIIPIIPPKDPNTVIENNGANTNSLNPGI